MVIVLVLLLLLRLMELVISVSFVSKPNSCVYVSKRLPVFLLCMWLCACVRAHACVCLCVLVQHRCSDITSGRWEFAQMILIGNKTDLGEMDSRMVSRMW